MKWKLPKTWMFVFGGYYQFPDGKFIGRELPEDWVHPDKEEELTCSPQAPTQKP